MNKEKRRYTGSRKVWCDFCGKGKPRREFEAIGKGRSKNLCLECWKRSQQILTKKYRIKWHKELNSNDN